MGQTIPNLPPVLEPLPPLEEPKVSVLRWVFRFLRWSTYLATLVTLLLLLHKTPAPVVASTPQAAAMANGPVKAMRSVRAARYPWAVKSTPAATRMATRPKLSRS